MRCPKCQYISFDAGERCRNCGYEFALTAGSTPRALDLPIQTGQEAIGPLADFALEASPAAVRQDAPKVDVVAPVPGRPITSSFDLPLFKERKDDRPRIAPATPRPPLSVRRSTPTPPRVSDRTLDEPVLGFAVDDVSDSPRTQASKSVTAISATADADDDAENGAASLAPRVLAGLVDLMILTSIAAIVLYLTLRICGVPVSHLAVIPPVPFVSFLLLIVGGYFTLFTAAGGQTIGKMAAGIRVIPVDDDAARVPLGRSVLRAAAYIVSALPAGLGFIPAFVSAEKRAIHDRLADTRVVKA